MSHHRREDETVPAAIGGLYMQGQDANCGFCCYHDTGITCRDPVLPQSFEGVYTNDEWLSLVRRVDEAFDSTTLPVCPCCLLGGGLPYCCAVCFFETRRANKIALVIAQENARLAGQGVEWIRLLEQRTDRALMALRWNEHRPAFEAANPHCRKVSREPLSSLFMSKEMKLQMVIAAVATGTTPAQGGQAASAALPAPSQQSMEVAAVAPSHSPAQQQPLLQQQQLQPPPYSQQSLPASPFIHTYEVPPAYGNATVYPQPPTPFVQQQQPVYIVASQQQAQAHVVHVQPQAQAQAWQSAADCAHAESVPATAGAAAPFCSRCGAQAVDSSASFCARCGSNIVTV